MSNCNDDPGGGGGTNASKRALPVTSAWAGDRMGASSNTKMRSFEEIVQEAKSNRNILEIHLKKNVNSDDPSVKPSNLTLDQFGELLFDKLNINSEDCICVNYASHRYDTREIMMRSNIDLSPFIQDIDDFYGHSVSTKRQASNVVRVFFSNVPLNVPDEEILHLCSFYGKAVQKVEYERITNPKSGKFSTLATRFVDMEITPGKHFLNFYWMEDPLPGDQGCRITVLHSGQERQCSHCLKTANGGCSAQGQGKVCKELGTRMTRMIDYTV